MLTAALWGSIAASSLIVGAILGFAKRWPPKLVGAVLAFGGGALVASISFELAEEGVHVAGPVPVGIGLAIGALTYFFADRAVSGVGKKSSDASSNQGKRRGGGTSLAVGAFLDGIPEQAMLGIGMASGTGVSAALMVAIYVSNLPEAIGSSNDMHEAGASRKKIFFLWVAVAAVCALSTVAGFAVADLTSGSVRGAIDGFAAGALLVMLVDSLIPEAREKSGDSAGLITVLGFALATGLSLLS